jgi:hypothetical protein
LIRGLTDFLVLLVPMVFSLCLVNSIISATLTKVGWGGDIALQTHG